MPFETKRLLIVAKPLFFEQTFWDSPEGRCLTCGKDLTSKMIYHMCETIRNVYIPECRCRSDKDWHKLPQEKCLRHRLLGRPINNWPTQFRPEQL